MSFYSAPEGSPLRTPYRVLKCLARGPMTSIQVMDELGLEKIDTALRHLNIAYEEGLVDRRKTNLGGSVFRYTFSLNK